MRSDGRHRVLRMLPSPVRTVFRAVREYRRRLFVVPYILHEIKGRTPSDQRTVVRSMARAPFELLTRLDRWTEPFLLADAEVEARGLGLFAVRARSDDLCHALPSHFASLFACIRPLVGDGDVTVDAGANLGAVTLFLAKSVGPRGRVVSFEMAPDTAAQLRRTVELNRLENVTIVARALSDKAGDRIAAHVEQGYYGQASIMAAFAAGSPRTIEVGTTTLDESLATYGEIALMKMDLEGAEMLALAGAGDVLSRIRNIVFESREPEGGDAGAFLRKAGFVITPVDTLNFLARRTPRGP